MTALRNFSELIVKLCQLIGGLCMVLIVLITMSDVVTRYLFKLTGGEMGFTVKGTVELVSYLMMFALITAFVAYVERSQIIVDIFTQKLPYSLKAYMMGFFMIGFSILGLIFAWGLYGNAVEATKFGNVTQDLRISMTPIYGFSAILCVLLCIRALLESINIFVTGTYFEAEETGS